MTAIDGRALRRSFGDAPERSPLHPVHAFAAESGLLPGQVRVDGRSKGITAVTGLLELRGRTVTADAMHRRRDTAGRDTETGGDHLLAPRAARRRSTTTRASIRGPGERGKDAAFR